MKDIGVYIHIPFCKSKCEYCDFTSFQNKDEVIEKYVEALKLEIFKSNINKYNIKTLYIGGGTPSYIKSEHICGILSGLKFNAETEVTIEINPGTVNKLKLQEYYNAGVNRLSIGLQSTDDNILKKLGRIHTYEQFLETYTIAREVGFKNINVDLMIGLENQNIELLGKTLNDIISISPEHISVYSLIIEEGTKLYEKYINNKLNLPNDETERQMYWLVKGKLEEAGYIHYEISNFGKKGFYSRHNLDCWNQKEYLGFGLGSHSYIEGKRFCNISEIDNYINNIFEGRVAENIVVNEIQNKNDEIKEYVMLGLRKINGISLNDFKEKFDLNFYDAFEEETNQLLEYGLIEEKEGYVCLSKKGIDLANIVWEKFV